MNIEKAIFLTNIFADYHPEEHKRLWSEFEKETPATKRNGPYGSDNLAYISWLKSKQEPLFISFVKEHVDIKTL